MLQDRGILYAPDFAANGGGIINAAAGILRVSKRGEWVGHGLQALEQTVDRILARARVEAISPHEIAGSIMGETLRAQAA